MFTEFDTDIVEQIVTLDKKMFPKHGSLEDEFMKKRNSYLLYNITNENRTTVSGFVMFSCPSSGCATITRLAVMKRFRRHGYGERLVKEAIEKCRSKGVNRISVHVDPLRTSAMQLYNKLGFQVDSLVKSYYSSDRDAYRMYIEFDDK